MGLSCVFIFSLRVLQRQWVATTSFPANNSLMYFAIFVLVPLFCLQRAACSNTVLPFHGVDNMAVVAAERVPHLRE